MVKFCLGFLLLFSCVRLVHSQDFGSSSIVKIEGVEVIQNYKSSSDISISKSDKSSDKIIKKILKNKNVQKNHIKLGSIDSRKHHSEKAKTQITLYKNSENESVFSTSSGKNISAVFCSTPNFDLKKDFNGYNNQLITLFEEHLIKKNTYFYLFSRDTGESYQFFNKPPPFSI